MNAQDSVDPDDSSRADIELVTGFVRFVNEGDIASASSLFAEDGLVNDQLRNFWGREAIGKWLERDIFAMRVQLEITEERRHYGVTTLTAEITGEFEGLALETAPMVVELHFTMSKSKIARLLILLVRDDAIEPELRRLT
jgi:hypothetical protein